LLSTREFRDKQKIYLDQIDCGAELLIKRGKGKSYKIVPVMDDETLMSKEDFFEKIDRAEKSIKDGKGKTVTTKEELFAYLDSL